MRDLMTSGRFALLTRLTRKALRLYDEMGLLTPTHLDPETGYHWYSQSQLLEAERINTLRSMHMPLDKIREVLRLWHDPALRPQLESYRSVLIERVDDLQHAVKVLDALLDRPQTRYEVRSKAVDPQPYLGQRRLCLPETACAFITGSERHLRQTAHQAGVRTAGALLARYHDTDQEDVWDVEVCLPFTGEGPSKLLSGMYQTTFTGGQTAFTIHEGEYGDAYGSMQGAYAAVWQWIEAQGLEVQGAPFEVYLFDQRNASTPEEYRTEIAWQVAGSKV